MKARHRRLALLVLSLAGLTRVYRSLVQGALTLDLGIGRRVRPLGPLRAQIAADPDTVFDVIASPYLGTTPHAMQDKLRVLERGTDMVLAQHFTDVGRGRTAMTLETVRFERPHRITFGLVRGPVPHVTETFELQPKDDGTAFCYTGEMGADFWALGAWWSDKVALHWEKAVEASLASVKVEAERLAATAQGRAKVTRVASRRALEGVQETN